MSPSDIVEMLFAVHEESLLRYQAEKEFRFTNAPTVRESALEEYFELGTGYHASEQAYLAREGYGYRLDFFNVLTEIESGKTQLLGFYEPLALEFPGYELVDTDTGEISHMPAHVVEVDLTHAATFDEELSAFAFMRSQGLELTIDLVRKKKNRHRSWRSIAQSAQSASGRRRSRRMFKDMFPDKKRG